MICLILLSQIYDFNQALTTP